MGTNNGVGEPQRLSPRCVGLPQRHSVVKVDSTGSPVGTWLDRAHGEFDRLKTGNGVKERLTNEAELVELERFTVGLTEVCARRKREVTPTGSLMRSTRQDVAACIDTKLAEGPVRLRRRHPSRAGEKVGP